MGPLFPLSTNHLMPFSPALGWSPLPSQLIILCHSLPLSAGHLCPLNESYCAILSHSLLVTSAFSTNHLVPFSPTLYWSPLPSQRIILCHSLPLSAGHLCPLNESSCAILSHYRLVTSAFSTNHLVPFSPTLSWSPLLSQRIILCHSLPLSAALSRHIITLSILMSIFLLSFYQ